MFSWKDLAELMQRYKPDVSSHDFVLFVNVKFMWIVPFNTWALLLCKYVFQILPTKTAFFGIQRDDMSNTHRKHTENYKWYPEFIENFPRFCVTKFIQPNLYYFKFGDMNERVDPMDLRKRCPGLNYLKFDESSIINTCDQVFGNLIYSGKSCQVERWKKEAKRSSNFANWI